MVSKVPRRRRLPDEKGIETNVGKRQTARVSRGGGAASPMRRGLKHSSKNIV